MLGGSSYESVIGSGVDNTDHDAMKAFVRAACDAGLAILFIYPDSKLPVDMRTAAQRNKEDRAAQEAAREAGRRDWANVKSPSGLTLATTDKAVADRYLQHYIRRFSTWVEVAADGTHGKEVKWSAKGERENTIAKTVPTPVNVAVEVGGSRLVVVDCDTAAQMRRWFEVAEIPLDEAPPPTVITPGQRNAEGEMVHSDGGHFYFTVPDGVELPTNLGAMTWGGDDGFAVLWRNRYVLIPPSTRPEGAYEQVGDIYDVPDWLVEEMCKVGAARAERAYASAGGTTENEDPELSSAIDAWAETVSWADLLTPFGWVPAPRADSCGCPVWTAPGDHASPKSATAHDGGCGDGRYTVVNAPLHIWTDHDVPPFDEYLQTHKKQNISKLQAFAAINHGGNVGKAMDELGVLPDKSVEPGIDVDALTRSEVDHSSNGDFELPAPPTPAEAAVMTFRCSCGEVFPKTVLGASEDFDTDDEGNWWHAEYGDDGVQDGGHPVVEQTSETIAATGETVAATDSASVAQTIDFSLDALPADFGKAGATPPAPTAAASPYPDDVAAPEPDVFDSVHNGVPRIAPFSHWRDMPPPEYIIDNLLEHGGLTSIIGPPGVGKSSVALDMACHIAIGKRWQGRQTLKTNVLYLPGEGLAGAVQRIRAFEAAHEVELGDGALLGNGIILVGASNEAWGDIGAFIARQEIGLIIFDTFARMSLGLEENSATDVGKAVRRFDKLRELTNAGVMVVHHTAKGTEIARGSSALNGALDSELLVRSATWDTSQITDDDGRLPGKPIELWTTKQKNSEALEEPIPLLMINAANQWDIHAPLIVGPNGHIDPMQGDVVLARPVPESLVETAIRIREYIDRFPKQGATRADLVSAVRPDPYTAGRADAPKAWKLKVAEAVDRALEYELIQTLTGTDSGSRYVPSTGTADQARTLHAAKIVADVQD